MKEVEQDFLDLPGMLAQRFMKTLCPKQGAL